jgi:PAS domain S-box-containing protein
MAAGSLSLSECENIEVQDQLTNQRERIAHLEELVQEFYQWPQGKNERSMEQQLLVGNKLPAAGSAWRFILENSLISEIGFDRQQDRLSYQRDRIAQLEKIIQQFNQWPQGGNPRMTNQSALVESKLHVTEDLWRYIIENSSDMINIVDRDGLILYNNGALDVNYRATVGIKMSSLVLPEIREKLEDAIRKVFLTGESICIEVADPQKQLWCMNRLAPIRFMDRIIAVMFMISDITELKNVQDSLKDLNRDLEQKVAERTHELQVINDRLEKLAANQELQVKTLYQITSIASEAPEIDILLNKLLHVTLQAVKCDIGVIHLSDPETHLLTIAVKEQLSGEPFESMDFSGNTPPWNLVYSIRKAFYRENCNFWGRSASPGSDAQISEYLGVPIQAKGKTLGVLSLLGGEGSLSDDHLIQFIGTISDQIGLAIESARLRKQTEHALITEERQRLARDLHDSVSQSLYGLVLSADAGEKLLAGKDYETLDAILEKIKQTSVQSLKEIRQMLHQLRPHSLQAGGLVEALDLRLNTVERRSGIEAEMHAEGIDRLPLLISQEIYLVALEALNNTLKHSQATTVSISISGDLDRVEMVIRDNGRGFDQGRRTTGGIGIGSMQERVSNLGGEFHIQSHPDRGTQIRVIIPINPS